jgi:hypothetical protein
MAKTCNLSNGGIKQKRTGREEPRGREQTGSQRKQAGNRRAEKNRAREQGEGTKGQNNEFVFCVFSHGRPEGCSPHMGAVKRHAVNTTSIRKMGLDQSRTHMRNSNY